MSMCRQAAGISPMESYIKETHDESNSHLSIRGCAGLGFVYMQREARNRVTAGCQSADGV